MEATKLLKPTQFAEHSLLTAILEGKYPPGATLPGERALARELGVTRPTLRETLHRLAAEGWITIHHGKATIVNDYWKQGGLGLLSTMAKYGQYLPKDFISHLLELRVVLIPSVAAIACERNPKALADHLAQAQKLEDDPEAFSRYDWQLQELMARASDNCTFPMILNDFGPLFRSLARTYFSLARSRKASRKYYGKLNQAMEQGPKAVQDVARGAMEESIAIWKDLHQQEGG
ncbi:MAG: GntR family transcriptional regulator [Desulfatibacillum sp.]|nr:GntR family transcriptional regulator [Desulfatibacillum sp.]